LGGALDAISAQTFTDYELIICDNASTDRTQHICSELATRDSRVRYIRHPENIGVNRNFNRTFELSRAPYFHWAAADDLCAPELLERLVVVLDARPEVGLCYARTREIDARGATRREYGDGLNLEQAEPHRRFAACLWKIYMCNPNFGLYRASALRKTGLEGSYSNSDVVMLCSASLHGRIVEIPEVLFYRRVHAGMTVQKFASAHDRMVMASPGSARRLTFPGFRFFGGFIAAVHNSGLPLLERLRCYARLHIVWRRWRSRLWDDLRFAWRFLLA
jgi:glycosyltransferase involved in cell wall biosynthesis